MADPRNRKVEGVKRRESRTSLIDIGESVEKRVHESRFKIQKPPGQLRGAALLKVKLK